MEILSKTPPPCPFKGTRAQDYNRLKVDWLDKPELVLLTDIRQNFITSPFIFSSSFEFLSQGTHVTF